MDCKLMKLITGTIILSFSKMRDRTTGASSESYKDDERTGAPVIGGEAKRTGSV